MFGPRGLPFTGDMGGDDYELGQRLYQTSPSFFPTVDDNKSHEYTTYMSLYRKLNKTYLSKEEDIQSWFQIL